MIQVCHHTNLIWECTELQEPAGPCSDLDKPYRIPCHFQQPVFPTLTRLWHTEISGFQPKPSWIIIFFLILFICCSLGKLWRRRTVIQAPQGDGRPCPSQMEQWKPCLVKPCYSWKYGKWSECKSEVSLHWSSEAYECRLLFKLRRIEGIPH